MPKTRLFAYSFLLHTVWVDSFNHLDVATDFNEITQNNGHYAVQGHIRSPISVPTESPYVTSY